MKVWYSEEESSLCSSRFTSDKFCLFLLIYFFFVLKNTFYITYFVLSYNIDVVVLTFYQFRKSCECDFIATD